MTIPLTLESWNDKSNGDEAVLLNWFVRAGQTVKPGQVLAEVMVEKVNLEIVAPQPAIVQTIVIKEGAIVTPGTVLAFLGEPTELETTPQNGKHNTSNFGLPVTDAIPKKEIAPYVAASPAARRLAKRLQLDLAKIARKLPAGSRLNELAVRNFATLELRDDRENPRSLPTPTRRQRQSNLRKLIRHRVSRAVQLSAAVTLTRRIDVTSLVEWLAQSNQERPQPPLTFLAALLRATALALVEYPLLNATLQGEDVLYFLERNIGLVLPVEDGVIVPVVRAADRLSLTELAQTIATLEEGVRQKTLRLRDTVGSTFTISDMGPYGVDSFTPILNLDQAGVLGVGRIVAEPVWLSASLKPLDRFELHHFVWLSLTFDHRLLDGPTAALFLQSITNYLQEPNCW